MIKMKDDLFADISWFKPHIGFMQEVWECVDGIDDDQEYQAIRCCNWNWYFQFMNAVDYFMRPLIWRFQ